MAQVELLNYLEDTYLTGPYLAGQLGELTGVQVELLIQDTDDDKFLGMQTDLTTGEQNKVGSQVKIFPLAHNQHPKYLVDTEGYLSESYLSAKLCALQSMQVDMAIASAADDHIQGVQVDQKIVDADDDHSQGMQVDAKINAEFNLGFQVDAIHTQRLGAQANFVIYNITQLRILCEFPSRGDANQYGTDAVNLDNANWKTLQVMESGDLGKLANLNTDVLEQRIQSDTGVTVLELRCDTGAANTFVDTVGILEHNITTSATIVMQGSDDENFGTVKFQFNVNPTDPYSIYIAPTLPTAAARYYRILITDTTNPDDFIKIGSIVFGSSNIFSVKETFDNPVSFGRKHFKDGIKTEGFTGKSNDRAIRRFLGLNFSNIDVEGGNYELFQNFFDFAKTDLKCLIIPTPTKPTVLTVWSKLTGLPSESHQAIDVTNDEQNAHWAGFSLDWDESE